jgi:hypothetical protein
MSPKEPELLLLSPASSRIRSALLAGLLLLLAATHASAHAGSLAFWRVTFQGSIAVSQILVDMDDVARLAPTLPTTTGPVREAGIDGLDTALLAHFVVLQGEVRAPARIVAARVLSSGLLEVQAEHTLESAATSIALRSTFHAVTDETHRVIARVERGRRVASLVFTASEALHDVPAEASRQSWWTGGAPEGSARAMLLAGIAHILTGYDHLVFLACLLMAGGRLRSLAGIVSAFTVAHSITLVLAAMQVLTPPAQFVEPAIAISIAYVAIENLVADPGRSRWPTAFGFGLIHGFGFAGTLDMLGLPLGQWLSAVLAFNVGVEIGQLAIVAISLPLVVVIARSPWHTAVVRCASSAVLGLSVFWFVERLQ